MEIRLPEITLEQRAYLEEISKGYITMDMTCPRCGRKYGEHTIGGGDPCRVR